jgi:hypothetical protein
MPLVATYSYPMFLPYQSFQRASGLSAVWTLQELSPRVNQKTIVRGRWGNGQPPTRPALKTPLLFPTDPPHPAACYSQFRSLRSLVGNVAHAAARLGILDLPLLCAATSHLKWRPAALQKCRWTTPANSSLYCLATHTRKDALQEVFRKRTRRSDIEAQIHTSLLTP